MSGDDTKPTSRTNWDRLQAMSDEEIDCSDIPPLSDAFFARARLVIPNAVQLDADVLQWFRQHHANYSAHINEILRHYIESFDQAA